MRGFCEKVSLQVLLVLRETRGGRERGRERERERERGREIGRASCRERV